MRLARTSAKLFSDRKASSLVIRTSSPSLCSPTRAVEIISHTSPFKAQEFQERIRQLRSQVKNRMFPVEKIRLMGTAARLAKEIEDEYVQQGFGHYIKRDVTEISRDILHKQTFQQFIGDGFSFLQEHGLTNYNGHLTRLIRPGAPFFTVKQGVMVSPHELPYFKGDLIGPLTRDHVRLFTLLTLKGGIVLSRYKNSTRHAISISTGHMENFDYFREVVPKLISNLTGLLPSYSVQQIKYSKPRGECKEKPFSHGDTLNLSLGSKYLTSYLDSLGFRAGGKNVTIIPEPIKQQILNDGELRSAALGTLFDVRSTVGVHSRDDSAKGSTFSFSTYFAKGQDSSFWKSLLEKEGIKFNEYKSKKKSIINVSLKDIPKLFDVAKPSSAYLVARTALVQAGIPAPPEYDKCLTLLHKNIGKVKSEAPWILPHIRRVLSYKQFT